jgi:peptidoglycan/xylan/chitin deacetylase (PgdA/CDA1 family)
MNHLSHWTMDNFYGLLSRGHLSLFSERSSLCTFLFHGIFTDEKEARSGSADPQQGITVGHLREFIAYYLEQGYVFVSPSDIIRGLDPGKNYALITFDDGYYNNNNAIPALREFNVPATLFVSTNHVLENKNFWWDVVYRQRMRRHASPQDLQKEYAFLKQKKNGEIESYLLDVFGSRALQPAGDNDRPFTSAELRQFSRESLITIGNHTANHAILTNYSHKEARAEIFGAQESLLEITGIKPSVIAYPNGNYAEGILEISKEAGLQLGITVQPGKNYLPVDTNNNGLFKLNRFTLWGNKNIRRQCEFLRTEIGSARIRNRFNTWNRSTLAGI